MSEIKDGGSAFPNWTNGSYAIRGGMTLRDWFAGKALQGLCSKDSLREDLFKANKEDYKQCVLDQIAKDSYDMADAMLAEREKGR